VRSAPLGTPRTASRIRGSGCRRRAGARLLLAGDTTFEDGLGIIHYCRLGDLLRVVCDEGDRARLRVTVPSTIACSPTCSVPFLASLAHPSASLSCYTTHKLSRCILLVLCRCVCVCDLLIFLHNRNRSFAHPPIHLFL